MATEKQVRAAKKNVKKARSAAEEQRTIAHLPAEKGRGAGSRLPTASGASVVPCPCRRKHDGPQLHGPVRRPRRAHRSRFHAIVPGATDLACRFVYPFVPPLMRIDCVARDAWCTAADC
jgi:hypothetical protein